MMILGTGKRAGSSAPAAIVAYKLRGLNLIVQWWHAAILRRRTVALIAKPCEVAAARRPRRLQPAAFRYIIAATLH
jgi:hypothetical protein